MSKELISLIHKKTAAESIGEINSNITTLQNSMVKLHEAAKTIGLEFEGLNAVSIIANIEAEINAFTTKYGAVLEALAANAQADKELNAKISHAVDVLLK